MHIKTKHLTYRKATQQVYILLLKLSYFLALYFCSIFLQQKNTIENVAPDSKVTSKQQTIHSQTDQTLPTPDDSKTRCQLFTLKKKFNFSRKICCTEL